MEMLSISRVSEEAELAEARELIRDYASSLDFDLGFQSFDEELAALSRVYGPPHGCLLLARCHGVPVGCVGIRRLDETTCELKRLFVRPRLRGLGLGRCLVNVALASARELGYATVRLDTVPAMAEAIALYRSLGFVEIAPYRHNPQPGAAYFELDLRRLGTRLDPTH